MPLAPLPPADSDEAVQILLVDDDAGILETLTEIFTDLGYRVDTAARGAAAKSKIDQKFYHLALLDIRLPDMLGTELVAYVKGKHPDTVCIMATGDATKDTAVAALNLGAHAYLEKPIDVLRVTTMVRSALLNQDLEFRNRQLLAELRALGDVTDSALATLELSELLASALDRFVFYHAADAGAIYLFDAQTEKLTERVTRGEQASDGGETGPAELSALALERQVVMAHRPDEADPIPAVEQGIARAVAVPLRSRNRAIGAVWLAWRAPRRVNSDTLARLHLFADRAAVLIDNARLYDAERYIARTLAESFISRTPARADVQLASRYVAASEVAQVGGDYFDFIELSEGRLGVVIGDVCGKDLPAVRYTAMAKYYLRAYAYEDPSPSRVLTQLNRALYREMSDDCMFVTMIYGVLNTQTGTFTYSSGAHPNPILYAARTGECRELMAPDGTGGMLGAFEQTDFAERTIDLEPGSVLALFTDGVTEARTGLVMLESAGVQEVIRAHASESARQIADAIYSTAVEFAKGVLRDDVAIVVIKNA